LNIDRKLIERAARKTLVEWGQEDGFNDLVNDMWVWYLERPSVQEKLSSVTYGEQLKILRNSAKQILSANALAHDVFAGNTLYSSDSIKDALKGRSNNKYLNNVLPEALERLAKKNPGHAEAIRIRYISGLVPISGSAEQASLKRAHQSLTEEVNVLYLSSGSLDGPGSRYEVYPHTRKPKGGYNDPTADAAIALLGANPEERALILEETPLCEAVKGKG